MVTVGPKPHQEAAHGPGPSLDRLGDGAQQRSAGAEVVHPSGPLAGMCRGFRVSRRVASRRPVSTALGCQALGVVSIKPPRSSSASNPARSWSPGLRPGVDTAVRPRGSRRHRRRHPGRPRLPGRPRIRHPRRRGHRGCHHPPGRRAGRDRRRQRRHGSATRMMARPVRAAAADHRASLRPAQRAAGGPASAAGGPARDCVCRTQSWAASWTASQGLPNGGV